VTAMLGTCQNHVAMTVQPSRGNTDDLRTLLLQHLAVIRVGLRGLEALSSGGTAFFIFVRNGDDLHPLYAVPDCVQSVPIITPAGSAYDDDSILCAFRSCRQARNISRKANRCTSDELSSFHNLVTGYWLLVNGYCAAQAIHYSPITDYSSLPMTHASLKHTYLIVLLGPLC